MIFTYEYKPVFEDFDKNAELTLSAMVKILENAGGGHSDLAGDNVFYIKDLSRAWILTDWQIEKISSVKYGDIIKADTWSEGFMSPLVTNRDFIMYKNDEVCLKATTRWILLDTTTGRPSRLSDDILEKYKPEQKTVFDDQKLIKIPSISDISRSKEIEVQRRDIDFNNHVHNLTYLDYALETIPEDVYDNVNFSSLRISYKTALKNGDKATCKYSFTENSHVIQIENDSKEICALIRLK